MTATITATYEPDVNGYVQFTPSVSTVIVDSVAIQIAKRYVATVVNGVMSIDLPATDVGNPSDWTYRVYEDFTRRSYSINAPTGTSDLSDLSPIEGSTGKAVYPSGPQGPTGPQGERGAIGATGSNGKDADITISETAPSMPAVNAIWVQVGG